MELGYPDLFGKAVFGIDGKDTHGEQWVGAKADGHPAHGQTVQH